MEREAELLLMDEAPGRRIADSRGMTVTGTLDILILMKEEGKSERATPLLDQLTEAGFHMSDDLRHEVLRQAGEE